jgi:CheY-like chemotaxis protein
VLQSFSATLLLLIAIGAVLLAVGWLLWRRHARRARRGIRPPAETQPPAPAPTAAPPPPALSIASFAPLPPRAAPAVPAAPVPRGASATGPARLLVVDDSAVARAKLRKLFQAAGFLVDLAADGDEALVLIASKPYAVLITDLEMPKLNGFQLIAAVQANPGTEDLPIIAITGHDELSAQVDEMKGLYGLFKKPWNDGELQKRVTNVATLRRRRAGD